MNHVQFYPSMITFRRCILSCTLAFLVVVNGQSAADIAVESNRETLAPMAIGGLQVAFLRISITEDPPLKLTFVVSYFHIDDSEEIDKE